MASPEGIFFKISLKNYFQKEFKHGGATKAYV